MSVNCKNLDCQRVTMFPQIELCAKCYYSSLKPKELKPLLSKGISKIYDCKLISDLLDIVFQYVEFDINENLGLIGLGKYTYQKYITDFEKFGNFEINKSEVNQFY